MVELEQNRLNKWDVDSPSGFALVCILIFSLYVTITPEIFGVHIRLGLSDVLLFFFFLLIASQYRKARALWKTDVASGYLLLFITLWLLFNLGLTWYQSGYPGTWAVFNKMAGWLVLCCYFYLGIYLRLSKVERIKLVFVLMFCAWLFALYAIIIHRAYIYRFEILVPGRYNSSYLGRPEALMGNPNALAILIGIVILFQISLYHRFRAVMHPVFYLLALGLLILVMFYCRSRSAWLGFVISLVFLLFHQRNIIKPLMTGVLAALVINFLVFHLPDMGSRWFHALVGTDTAVEQKKNIRQYGTQAEILIKDHGINERLRQLHTALDYWLERPLTGIGLGQYLRRSVKEDKNPNHYVLHNSGLWLLTETGLVGFVLFCVFFLRLFLHNYRASRAGDEYSKLIILLLLFMLGASQGTEILYQRYMWLLLGLSVLPGVSINHKKAIKTEQT